MTCMYIHKKNVREIEVATNNGHCRDTRRILTSQKTKKKQKKPPKYNT